MSANYKKLGEFVELIDERSLADFVYADSLFTHDGRKIFAFIKRSSGDIWSI